SLEMRYVTDGNGKPAAEITMPIEAQCGNMARSCFHGHIGDHLLKSVAHAAEYDGVVTLGLEGVDVDLQVGITEVHRRDHVEVNVREQFLDEVGLGRAASLIPNPQQPASCRHRRPGISAVRAIYGQPFPVSADATMTLQEDLKQRHSRAVLSKGDIEHSSGLQ